MQQQKTLTVFAILEMLASIHLMLAGWLAEFTKSECWQNSLHADRSAIKSVNLQFDSLNFCFI